MAVPGGRIEKVRDSLTSREWLQVGGMAFTIVALNVIGWAMLLLALRGHHHVSKTAVFGFGTGILAYTLGMRHAFDADHIAAIDNTTRKLIQDGDRPLSVGYFFSLGHSSIVFVLAVLLNFGIRALNGAVQNNGSGLHHWTGIIGTSVSGTFLCLIGILNLVVLVSIVRVSREMRQGRYDDAELERQLDSRGLMNRIFGGYARRIDTPWKMYPVGALFGLGFDTATEVALLVLAGSAVVGGLPVLRRALVADPVRRGHVPLRHHRRLLHELRLRLGLRQAHPQDLLQPHHHRLVGVHRSVHRHRRDPRSRRPGDEPERRVLDLHAELQHQPGRLHHCGCLRRDVDRGPGRLALRGRRAEVGGPDGRRPRQRWDEPERLTTPIGIIRGGEPIDRVSTWLTRQAPDRRRSSRG